MFREKFHATVMTRNDENEKERRKIRITIVCDVYGRENNGSDIVASNLITFMQNRGHDVRVLCADQTKRGRENYYVVPNLNLGKLANDYVERVGVTLARPVKKIIEEAVDGADVVHVMMPFFLGLAAAKVAIGKGIPLTAGFHVQAENFTSYFKLNKVRAVSKAFYRFVWKNLYRYCSAIHYPTAFMKDTFERSIGVKTPAFVVSNGVQPCVKKRETPKPEAYRDKIVVLTTGRYSPEKAQDDLIRAVGRSGYEKRIQLILAGQGQNEAYYKHLAEGLTNEPVFRLFSREEIVDALNYADMYVHPAKYELEGISCIEAISCGKLTIVSDSELSATRGFAIDGKCVFRTGDADDLAGKLDYWIEHEEERREYEEKYLLRAAAFDQTECMKRMEDMFLWATREEKGARFASEIAQNA